MFVQTCVKGMNGITLADAQDILTTRGLVCTWWRTARHISSAEIDERLTAEELQLHLNSFDDAHPRLGGLVREQTPFISFTAGSIQHHESPARSQMHSAHQIAMDYATSFGQLRGECFLFYCWVVVGPRPNVPVRYLAEDVRGLGASTKCAWGRPTGEIVAKIEVPMRQIEKFEHYECREGRPRRLEITLLETCDNPEYISPNEV